MQPTRTLAPAAGDTGGAAIDIVDLEAVSPEAAGTLNTNTGGFGPQTWASLKRDQLISRLAQLPPHEPSAVMRDLMRRALLSASTGPQDQAGAGAQSWLAARIRVLNARGLWSEAVALAERAPKDDLDAAQAGIEARTLFGDDAAACAALQAVSPPPEGPFWSKARAFCQIVSGDGAAAQLSLDVMREGADGDTVFVAAAVAALDGPKPNAALVPYEPIQIAMWRKAGLPPAAQNLEPLLAAGAQLARVTGTNDLTRLAATGSLVRLGLRGGDEFVAAAFGGAINADQNDDPEEASKKLPTAAGDAVYLKSIRSRTIPAAKASAFAALLQRAQARGEFPYVAQILSSSSLEIAPLPETAWAAPEVTRVLIYNGQVSRAESWFKALSMGSPSDQPVINAIRVYSWLKQPTEARASALDEALRWLSETAAKPGPNAAAAKARLTREGPILAALGVILPPDVLWAQDANGPGLAPDISAPALLNGMDNAARQGSAGEVVLDASLLLKGQGASAARSQTIAAILRAMIKVGLRKEAKALALEAMLGASARLGE